MTTEQEVLTDWQGQVVYVYLRGAGESLHSGIAMRDASIQTIHGRRFLVGRGLSDPRDWTGDLPMLAAWEDVIHVVLVRSPEEFLKRWQRAQEFQARADAPPDDTPQ